MGVFNAVIGALRVNLGLDSAEFENGVKRNQEQLKGVFAGFTVDLGAAAHKVGEALAEIPRAIGEVINRADELGKMGAKLGIPVEALSQLQHAADMDDVSLDSLSTGLRKLAQNMTTVGNGPAQQALAQLGVNARDASGKLRSTQDVLGDVADKFAHLHDSAGKTALAMAIFGKSGSDLIPLLNEGRAGLKDMADESDRLGLTISSAASAEANAFNDNLHRVGDAMQGIVTRITTAMLPSLVAISSMLASAAQWTAEFAGKLGVLAPYIQDAGVALAVMAAPAVLSGLAALITLIGTGLVGAIDAVTAAALANPLVAFVAAIALAAAAIYHFRDDIKTALGVDVVDIAKRVANFIIASFVTAVEDIGIAWQDVPNALGDLTIQAANSVISTINGMVQSTAQAMNWLIDQLNEKLHTGLPTIDLSKLVIGGFDNPYLNAAGKFLDDLKAKADANSGIDWIGNIGAAFSSAGKSADGAAGDLGTFNGALSAAGDHLKKVKTAAETLAGAISGSLSDGFKTIQDDLKKGMGVVQAFGDGLMSVIQSFIDKVASSAFQNAADSLANLLVPGGNAGASSSSGPDLISVIGSGLKSILHFANGGAGVIGGAGGRDSQLFTAMVTPGEPYAFGQDAIDGLGGGLTFAPHTVIQAGQGGLTAPQLKAALDARDSAWRRALPSFIADARRRGALA